MKAIIYHNPRCSKSRLTLDLLKENEVETIIVEYLKSTPGVFEFKNILKMLGKTAHEVVRKGEPVYKELGLDKKDLSEMELIKIMVKNPKLIERPIVVVDQKAVIGRPPENILEII
ncbi:arsenate reductase (glutaredoxin) [Rickettsiales bacterium]|nr:arsenate reductase (glutaredoxin) [Rickettsiales bacterium]